MSCNRRGGLFTSIVTGIMATQLSTEPAHAPALSLDGSDLHNNADGRNEDEAITPISRITGSELDEQDDPNSLPLPFCTRVDCSDSDPNSPWSRKMILTLDGGGIKGYSSLLVLKRIMFLVEQIELGHRPLWTKVCVVYCRKDYSLTNLHSASQRW